MPTGDNRIRMQETTRERLHTIATTYQHHVDACHRYDHTERVVVNALRLAQAYPDTDIELLETAAWLHDIGRGTERKKSESHADASARLAQKILTELAFSAQQITHICAAIVDHRFSLGRVPRNWEGRLLQDADRLDALGAIGIARTFAEGGQRALYHTEMPFLTSDERELDDSHYTIDHFFTKLLSLPATMHTPEARNSAERRIATMRDFLREFADEIGTARTI